MIMSQAPSPTHDVMCMGCGTANSANLGVTVHIEDDRVRGTVLLDTRHAGAPGFAHGGALAAIMDDLLGQVLIPLDRPGVTATMTVDFHAPALLGRTMDLEAWCERVDGRKLHMRGEIRDGETLVAAGSALFIHVDVSHWETSGHALPPHWAGWGATADSKP